MAYTIVLCVLRKRLLFRCQSRRSLGGTYSTLYVIPTNTLCVVANSGLIYSKLWNEMRTQYSLFSQHECPTCSSKSRLPFCLHKLKNLTCWPNRPMIWVWITHALLARHLSFYTKMTSICKEKGQRIKSESQEQDSRPVLHWHAWEKAALRRIKYKMNILYIPRTDKIPWVMFE